MNQAFTSGHFVAISSSYFISSNRRAVNMAMLIAALLFCSLSAQAQTLKGTITDGLTGEPVIGARVVIFKGTSAVNGTMAGLDGTYLINDIEPGTYDIEVTYFDYDTIRINEVLLTSGTVLNKDFVLSTGKKVVVITSDPRSKNIVGGFPPPKVITPQEIAAVPYNNVIDIIALTPGVTRTADGQLAFRGARPNGTRYYVDGMFIGSFMPSIPRNMIQEIETTTGGVSAQYGDVTGGIVNITTKGPSTKYFGGLELTTSQFLDPFGYNQLQGNIGGPVITKNDSVLGTKRAVLGFFAGASLNYSKVANPPAIDMYRMKDEALEEIYRNPVRLSPFGSGVVPAVAYANKSDMYTTRVKPNTSLLGYTFNGKLQYKPVEANYDVTWGVMTDRSSQHLYSFTNNMFNYENNPQLTDNNVRTYLRFHQYFDNSDSNAVFKQFYYNIQADYQRFDRVIQDEELKDNFFSYGYIGRFDRHYQPVYAYQTDTVNGKMVQSNYLQGYEESGVTFTPGGVNPVLERYTGQFFELMDHEVSSFSSLQSGGGLINGQSPENIYSLWTAPGSRTGSYQKRQDEQYNFNARAVAITKKHEFKAGFQYQQMTNRLYQVGVGAQGTSVQGLWTLARQLTNSHLTQLDKTQPQPVYSNGSFTDTINYPYQVIAGSQSTFDRNFRDYLISIGARDENGRLIDAQTRINLDQYRPEDLSLDMFSADELLNNGNSYVNYYGYDHLGNKQKGRSSIDDYLDPNKRSNPAYTPVYMAGYLEDRFEFRDLNIRAGLRVDRFDANQPVLRDPYSLYPVKTAGEVSSINNVAITHPGNIGEDYAVYVDDVKNPTRITGYRKGSQWYDATGAEVSDPNLIALSTSSGRIQPYLAGEERLGSASFRDYKPQVNIMPRISFSFPISQSANFFANYDVLTSRPSTGNLITYDDYYFIQSRATLTLPNPDLKPERRINYEIGLVQNIGRYSGFSVQAYYAQIRDLIQRVQINQAYPITYTTFGNVDFGNVKGFTFGYNLYRPGNSGVQLNLNYTLQFAEGTGSDAGTAANLINAGQPNLRTPFPLDFDRRHQLTAVLDYRFGYGDSYTGFFYKKKPWLEDAGFNIAFTALSGSPYSSQRNITQGEGVVIGVANRSSIEGTVNGSRLPWQFKADMRFDKNFYFNVKKNGKTQRSTTYLNAYIMVQNVFDARNVVRVYSYTGLADDDGYLASSQGEREIAQAIDSRAFTDQYSIKMNDPDNYIAPRFIRLGAAINF